MIPLSLPKMLSILTANVARAASLTNYPTLDVAMTSSMTRVW